MPDFPSDPVSIMLQDTVPFQTPRSCSESVSVLLQRGDPPQQLFNYLAGFYLEDGLSMEPACAISAVSRADMAFCER